MRAVDHHGVAAAAHVVDSVKASGKGDIEVHAPDGVSVRFDRGRFSAMMVSSGSGNSTLMRCRAGFEAQGEARNADQGNPTTTTAVVESALVPFPSWPFVFAPQHRMAPPASNAHEWP